MSKQTFHGSSESISEIRSEGMFGGLFTGTDDAARSHGGILHEIESPKPLSDWELNYEVDGAFDVAMAVARGNEAVAEAIMSKSCIVPESAEVAPEDFAEYSWELQRLRGELARRLGYTSVEMEDEHGTTWLCLPGCTVRAVQ